MHSLMAAEMRIHVERPGAAPGPNIVDARVRQRRKDPDEPRLEPLGHRRKIGPRACQPAEQDAARVVRRPPHEIDIEVPVDERPPPGRSFAASSSGNGSVAII